MRNFSRFFAAVLFTVILGWGCSKGGQSTSDGGSGSSGSGSTNTTPSNRKKITRLTPAAYYKVAIEMMEEQKKWSREVNELLKKRRQSFFNSFGLSEQKYRDYSMNNHAALQDYLRKNPWLDQKMNQLRSMYTQ